MFMLAVVCNLIFVHFATTIFQTTFMQNKESTFSTTSLHLVTLATKLSWNVCI